ncbi:MAG: sodium:proton antiporter [Pyrinomonadaceae bacterium]
MTFEIAIVLLVLLTAAFLFITEKLRVDLVALIVMSILLLTGIITPAQGLAGFSNSATLTVGAMFVLSTGLFRTGAVDFLGDITTRVFKRGYWQGIVAVMVIVGFLSAFINNTPVIAIFLPILLALSRETGISASKILMPVSFASMFGGVCTLIGTSTNILVSSIAEKNGIRSFTMFEFAPLGLMMFLFGTVYLLVAGIRLIPDRRGEGDLVDQFRLSEYLTEVVIMPGGLSVGKKIRDAPLVHDLDLTILKIEREGEVIQLPGPEEVLEANDVLLLRCDIEKIQALQSRQGVQFKGQTKWGESDLSKGEQRLLEAVIEPNSNLIASTLQKANFRERYGATVLAIRHGSRLLRERLSDTTLKGGDVLLVEIDRGRIPAFRRSGEFIVTSEMDPTLYRGDKALFAVAIVAAVVLAAAFNVIPIVAAAVIGATAMVLVGCLNLEEAYTAIEWKIIFLLAGVLSLGAALEESGAARLMSASLLTYVGVFGPIALTSAFYLITSLLTETMSNNATAALLAPIAIATAQTLGVDPVPFLMAITFAASASFMTPVGYQTNTMIYGPGQYRFFDFVKVGTPLNIMFWILATVMIPMIWSY